MSFTDRLVLWLHIGFAIFTIGPLAVAISSTPRYIRTRDVAILRYLSRITIIFTIGSLLVLVLGLVLGSLKHDFSHPWLTASLTLFIVAIALLILIIRDQRRAIKAVTPDSAALAAAAVSAAAAATAAAAAATAQADLAGAGAGATAPDQVHGQGDPGQGDAGQPGPDHTAHGQGAGEAASAQQQAAASAQQPAAGGATLAAHIASVERGRIAAMGGVVNLIWLVILALMVWRP